MDDQRSDGIEREIPSPEVSEKPTRRRFTAEYKLRILAEADACTERGALADSKSGMESWHKLVAATHSPRSGLAGTVNEKAVLPFSPSALSSGRNERT